jgi:alpha-ribazole phosphatase
MSYCNKVYNFQFNQHKIWGADLLEKEILLVRHGETDYNKKLRYQGHLDIDLNETGYDQAQKISKRISTKEIDEIYSSDLKRARNTAELIAAPHNQKVRSREGLREINVGDWEGLNYDDLNKQYPELSRKWFDNPASVRLPGGEMLSEFQTRVVDSFEEIIDSSKGEKIVVTAHGGTIRVWLAHLLKVPLNKNRQIEIHNTSLSIVKVFDGYPVIKLINSISHLES